MVGFLYKIINIWINLYSFLISKYFLLTKSLILSNIIIKIIIKFTRICYFITMKIDNIKKMNINTAIWGICFFLMKNKFIFFNESYRQFYYKIRWYCINGILNKFGYILRNSARDRSFRNWFLFICGLDLNGTTFIYIDIGIIYHILTYIRISIYLYWYLINLEWFKKNIEMKILWNYFKKNI